MIEIRPIDHVRREYLRLPNEPFTLWGRMRPSFENGTWRYTTERFTAEDVGEMCFPDESYDFDALSVNHAFLGAYDGDRCVGLALLADAWFKHMYLEDLKVNRMYRRQGVGSALIRASLELARARGYNGLYTVGQDNNLSACLFYLKEGFVIGGFDDHVYLGTSQQGKADIIFYLDR